MLQAVSIYTKARPWTVEGNDPNYDRCCGDIIKSIGFK